MVQSRTDVTVKAVPSIKDIGAEAWDACANPDPAAYDPFVSHAFLHALEASGCAVARTGWAPQHLGLEDSCGTVLAVAPCYLKSHSQGEYVFDYGWAEAYARAGGEYYPKLQIAVPFTPVPGRRFLVRRGADTQACEAQLTSALIELAGKRGASSFHATFLSEAEFQRLGALGCLQRTGQQFHWENQGFDSFDAFLATLASRKRKALKKERRDALSDGVSVTWVTGADLTETHWDNFYAFYRDTGNRKWGTPYLNRKFFSLLGQTLADRVLLVLAMREGRPIAGALNMIGGSTLYGRYWGAIEHRPYLHFEICYYQAIDFAIAKGLKYVQAGAQGEHKLARGYLPVTTFSAHWIADRRLARAVEDYLEHERRRVEEANRQLAELGPYRKGEGPQHAQADDD